MTYGSPASNEPEDVGAYLTRVRRGRTPEPDLVAEFTRRYREIGGSPLIEVTRRQAAALAARLGWPVEAGMRFSEPTIAAGLAALAADGARRIVAIILSPQYSPLLMAGYARAIDEALRDGPQPSPNVTVAGAWHTEPAFVAALAGRVRETLVAVSAGGPGGGVHVLMTAHSLPQRVAMQEPEYLEQLRRTASDVAQAARLRMDEWTFCWQSAGHEPGEWLKPDFADLMPDLAAAGVRDVVVAPIQFLADHLETLYDVDIGAREQAEPWGLRFRRIRALNDDPDLGEALAAVARRALQAVPSQGLVAISRSP
jgi:ferrochelatase